MNPVPYDFRKPVRLPQEWHKLLQGWFRLSTSLAGRGWAKQLPEPLELSAGTMEDCYAQAVLAELPADSIGQHIPLAGGTLPTMLILPRPLLLNIVGLMVGEQQTQSDRELTAVEEELADFFFANHWLPYFRETWPGPAPLLGLVQQREAQPSYSRLFSTGEVLLSLHWRMHGPFGDGQGQWLLPRQALLQALMKDQEAAAQAGDEKEAAVRRAQIVRALPLSIECILGTAQLRLSELARLQVGDVLLLDQRIGDDVSASVGGRQLFRGQVGRNGSWKAFRIQSFIEK
jgi:flagellar motor switch protein FliM